MVAIEAAMMSYLVPIKIHLPYQRGDLLSMLHEEGK